MITQVQAAASGQGRSNDLLSSDATYTYGEVQKSISFNRHEPANVGGQVVSANSLISETRYDNGALRRTFVTGLDVYGRVSYTNLYRSGDAGAYKSVSYGYHGTGALYDLVYPSTMAVMPYDRQKAVKQYGDQVATKVSNGVTSSYGYDEYGHQVREYTTRAHVYKWDGATAHYADRNYWKMHDGFGQPVWESLWELQTDSGAWVHLVNRQWAYYSTGELDASWDGSPQNVTDYRYAGSGTNLGRVTEIVTGIGTTNALGVATPRKTTAIGYDAYGRPNSTIVDGQFETKTKYDTLDRPVEVNEPNWTKTTTTRYGLTGKPWVESHYLNDGKTFNLIHHVDSLGREYQMDTPDGTIRTYYDAFDRPVKITDSRLTMNGGEADRSTYLKYDEAGNLVKKLNPVMTSATGQPYTDARRPFEFYEYDVLGRKAAEHRLITGNAISPLNMVWPSNATIATTRTQYDAFDRPTVVTDADGYQTKLTYDNSGNVVTVERQVWTKNADAEPQYTQAHQGFDWVTARTAYDGNARTVQLVDGRGNSKKKEYSLFGPTAEIDERGIKTKAYTYTPDGLPQATLEPDNESGAGMVTTEYREYSTRQFPTHIYRAHMHTQAGPGVGALTSYVYDHAGRPVSTTLPPDQSGATATITQSYHSNGEIKSSTDANSFPTRMEYDWAGRLIAKHEDARPGNQTDANAGLSAGLRSTYAYDASGNLIKKDERGLITEYRYNSLGKIISESRPRVGEGTATRWKLTTYRLDGLPTAKTSYTYQGNLASIPDVVDPWDPRISHSTGNMTMPWYYARGIQIGEVSWGDGHTWEYSKNTFVNGLGQRYFRKFWGNGGIYKIQQYANGAETGLTNYWSFWTHDQNGNLTSAWDTPTNADNNAPLDASLKQNSFSYQYSPSNKETRQDRDIRVRRQSKVQNNHLRRYYGGNEGVYLAASIATITTSYTERDQIEKTTTTDNVPYVGSSDPTRQDQLASAPTRHQRYSYFYDGRVWNSWTGDGTTDHGYKGVEAYDQRGREIVVYDSTGGPTNGAPGRVYTTYGTDGTVINRGEQNGAVIFNKTTTPTVSGLAGSAFETKADGGNSKTTYRYGNSAANALWQTQTEVTRPNNTPITYTETRSYNNHGSLIGHVRNSTSSYTTYEEGWCEAGPGSYYRCMQTVTKTENSPEEVIYGAAINDDGIITQETKPSVYSGLMTQSYSIDSRGNRLAVTGGDSHGYVKRYNADDQVVHFNNTSNASVSQSFCNSSGCYGVANRYNDFRYDPFGEQILTSTAQIEEQSGDEWLAEHGVWRDWNVTYTVQGKVQLILRKAGNYIYKCKSSTNCSLLDHTYRLNNYQYRDATYSLLDGYNDNTNWTGTRPFAVPRGVVRLDAPTQSLSSTLKINPLDVLTPTLPKLADPSKIGGTVTPKDEPAAVQTGESQKQVVKTDEVKSSAPTVNVSEGAILTLEVPADFDDGQGFEHPVYAAKVEELSWADFEKWWNAVAAKNADAAAMMSQQKADEVMGDVRDRAEHKIVELARDVTKIEAINKFGTYEDVQAIIIFAHAFDDPRQALDVYAGVFAALDQIKSGLSDGAALHLIKGMANAAREGLQNKDPQKKKEYMAQTSQILVGEAHQAAMEEEYRLSAAGGRDFISTTLALSVTEAIPGRGSRMSGNAFKYVRSKVVSNEAMGTAVRWLKGVVGLAKPLCRYPNSFAPSTLVRTLSGFVAISTLTVGTPVLAFNEKTGENGYYPITAVHKNVDPEITYLTLTDPDQKHKLEFVETTPGHPFYVTERSDTQPRPKPEGHEDLSDKWIGAGHLKIGDKIKQADGTIGLVANVINVQKTQEMFNLTVSEAHTYYVGQDGWLVHNAGGSTTVYRGTDFGIEYDIYRETGFLLSDSARSAYREALWEGKSTLAALRIAFQASRIADAQQMAIWGSRGAYIQAHGYWGQEIAVFGARSMVSVTTDPSVAKGFGANVMRAAIPNSLLHAQTIPGATESELLVVNGVSCGTLKR
ncbi:polymorphic toxin-type HINT domain-containing protein [Deinococcus aquaedulcis]|uniref:polymorphic toxin-type HINT domain-containing protein n=1 Tax=Deinococcus aquaedulcis TaxID=2840455 RepID=UPI001C8392CE|nr:polymorphic toxin-type HINT domain-containing protein [Deinococcus aquaedulcis]